MSKAFTREDDEGLTPVAPRVAAHAPHTPLGMRALQALHAQALAQGNAAEADAIAARLLAGSVPAPVDRGVVALGAEVALRDGEGRTRVVRVVTPDEVGLVDRGASPSSPLGAAVVGTGVGDVVELPGGAELAVVRIDWPDAPVVAGAERT